MAKVSRVKCKADSRHHRMIPYPSPSCSRKNSKHCHSKNKHATVSEKNDWEGATCSVCLEYPHNAVLLLCSSYNKGCRPYMCATSHRYSNCLEQYKNAQAKVTATDGTRQGNGSVDNSSFNWAAGQANDKEEVPELLCPLCRGQVKGWTVVEPARKYLNGKKRSCMQDKCSFAGTYKQLRKHVKGKHPLARPRAVDPILEEKWKKLECESARNDVISTIMSSTPGAIVLGDYVIEPARHSIFNDYDYVSDESLDDGFFPLESFNRQQGGGQYHHEGFHLDFDSLGEDDFGTRRPAATGTAVPGRGLHRLLLARGRNWRFRAGNRSRNL